MKTVGFCLLISTLFLLSLAQESPPIIPLKANIPLTTPQTANVSSFYRVLVQSTQLGNLLLLTATTDSNSYLNIYISTLLGNSSTNIYPNQINNNASCNQFDVDTCVMELPSNATVTVYIGVTTTQDANVTLQAIISDIFELKVGSSYTINMTLFQSGVLTLAGSETHGLEEVDIVLTYNTSTPAGRFSLLAAIDTIPQGYPATRSRNIGAFAQILKLSPILANQTYYIVIEGQIGILLHMTCMAATPSQPSLPLNSTVRNLTSVPIDYWTSMPFDSFFSDSSWVPPPLSLQLNAYSGYGVFAVDYCSIAQFSFQNNNGENGEFIVTPEDRRICYNNTLQATENGILVENLRVSIGNVLYIFAYQLSLFEGIISATLLPGLAMYGLLPPGPSIRTYELAVTPNKEYILLYQELDSADALSFTILKCSNQSNCSTVDIGSNNNSNSSNNSGKLVFSTAANFNYICEVRTLPTSQLTLQYLLQVLLKEPVQELYVGKQYLHEVSYNAYNFYLINLTSLLLPNYSQITVRLNEVSGSVLMLSSTTISDPTFDMLTNSTDIEFSWDSIAYLLDSNDSVLYFSVFGSTEAIYYLQSTVVTDVDVPERYYKLSDATPNQFVLTASQPYSLVMFASHSQPYSIYARPAPACIMYGYTLPIPKVCQSFPDHFTQQVVYFNISKGQDNREFKFTMLVDSGKYTLTELAPVLIGCLDRCYELVSVTVNQKDTRVIHSGRGTIAVLDNPTVTVSNSYLTLGCQNGSECVVVLNASLAHGGQMMIYLQSSLASEIEWSSKPMTFTSWPKKLYYTLRKYGQVNSFMFFSEAVALTIYYSIVRLDEHSSNLMNYTFPNTTHYEHRCKGNPLRGIHVVVVNLEMLNNKSCYDSGVVCLVVVSAYPDLSVEYDRDYLATGIGYYSCNTYQTFLPLGIVYDQAEIFSMNMYTHKISKGDANEDTNSTYQIVVKAISNCHPKIYVGPSYNDPTHQSPVYSQSTLTATDSWVNFTVLSETQCRYFVTLSSFPDYLTIVQNVLYQFPTNNGQVTVSFAGIYSPLDGYIVEVVPSQMEKITGIFANKVTENSKAVQPTENASNFSTTNATVLTLPAVSPYLHEGYLIKVRTKSPKVSILVRNPEPQPVILLHNQHHLATFNSQKLTMSYRFYSTSSVRVILYVSNSSPKVVISRNYNSKILFDIEINNSTSPEFSIPAANSELAEYLVVINNTLLADFTASISFEETPTSCYGHPQLYEGIVHHDVFVSAYEMNCYSYQSELIVGHDNITLDFVVTDGAASYGLEHRAYAISSSVPLSSWLRPLEGASLSTYRISARYMPKTTYSFCFYSQDSNLTNREYYIIITRLSMTFVPLGYSHMQLEGVYEIFELVESNHNATSLAIEVTACSAQPRSSSRFIVGSSSFQEVLQGRYTQLTEYYQSQGVIVARLDVLFGYYYVGVKQGPQSNQDANAYSIRVVQLPLKSSIMNPNWQLKSTQIVKIHMDGQNVNIELPKLSPTSNIEKQEGNFTLKYTIYLTNNTVSTGTDVPLPLQFFARCPNHADISKRFRQVNQPNTGVVMYNLQSSFPSVTDYLSSSSPVLFQVPMGSVAKRFNLTGKVQIIKDEQTLAYYYANNEVELYSERSNSTRIIFIVLGVLVGILAIAICPICCKKLRRNSNKTVAFEMANFENETDSKKKENRQGLTPAARKEGYGEFVDESVI